MSGHRNCVKCDHTSCSVQKHWWEKRAMLGKKKSLSRRIRGPQPSLDAVVNESSSFPLAWVFNKRQYSGDTSED